MRYTLEELAEIATAKAGNYGPIADGVFIAGVLGKLTSELTKRATYISELEVALLRSRDILAREALYDRSDSERRRHIDKINHLISVAHQNLEQGV